MCLLEFTYTAKYPDEVPIMEIKEVDNLDALQEDEITELMKEQV